MPTTATTKILKKENHVIYSSIKTIFKSLWNTFNQEGEKSVVVASTEGGFFHHWATKVKLLSHVRLFATPQTVAYQAAWSTGFSRQDYWSRLPFPSPGDLPNPGIEPRFPALQTDALLSQPLGKPKPPKKSPRHKQQQQNSTSLTISNWSTSTQQKKQSTRRRDNKWIQRNICKYALW